jgi:hypothetical protein
MPEGRHAELAVLYTFEQVGGKQENGEGALPVEGIVQQAEVLGCERGYTTGMTND